MCGPEAPRPSRRPHEGSGSAPEGRAVVGHESRSGVDPARTELVLEAVGRPASRTAQR